MDARRRAIRKAHLSFQLRWAKNIYVKIKKKFLPTNLILKSEVTWNKQIIFVASSSICNILIFLELLFYFKQNKRKSASGVS
jgi:hypothetical protein